MQLRLLSRVGSTVRSTAVQYGAINSWRSLPKHSAVLLPFYLLLQLSRVGSTVKSTAVQCVAMNSWRSLPRRSAVLLQLHTFCPALDLLLLDILLYDTCGSYEYLALTPKTLGGFTTTSLFVPRWIYCWIYCCTIRSYYVVAGTHYQHSGVLLASSLVSRITPVPACTIFFFFDLPPSHLLSSPYSPAPCRQ